MRGTRLLELTTADSAGGRRSRGGEEGEGKSRGGRWGRVKGDGAVNMYMCCVCALQECGTVHFIGCPTNVKLATHTHSMKLHVMPRLL